MGVPSFRKQEAIKHEDLRVERQVEQGHVDCQGYWIQAWWWRKSGQVEHRLEERHKRTAWLRLEREAPHQHRWPWWYRQEARWHPETRTGDRLDNERCQRWPQRPKRCYYLCSRQELKHPEKPEVGKDCYQSDFKARVQTESYALLCYLCSFYHRCYPAHCSN